MSRSPPTSIRVQLLSNGRYTVMLNESGAGSSRWRELAVTRWREDSTSDGWGNFVLLRDVATGAVWSAARQPCGGEPEAYDAMFGDGVARIARRDGTLATSLEVAVASDHDAELRRVTITNNGDVARELELTSYAELVLGSATADAAHPAFSKMFVQTEVQDELLLATRRRRTTDEPEVWAAHLVVSDDPCGVELELETDRARFLGRGRTLRDAAAMDGGRLSGTVGTVLDPIFSLRRRVIVAPGASARVAFWTLVAETREAVLELGRVLRGAGAAEAALASATARASQERIRLGLEAEDADRYARLAAPCFYADPVHRAAPEVLARARGGAPVLWTAGISGDRPIALVRVASVADLDEARHLLRAQLYWRSHRLGVDVVLLDARSTRDGDPLTTLAQAQRTMLAADTDAAPAGVFVLRDDEVSAALRDGLATAARWVLPARPPDGSPSPRALLPAPRPAIQIHPAAPPEEPKPLELDNGTGGFARDGREYVIRLPPGASTPAPWINVVANPSFGFIAAAEGGGYTWSINSQQNPLTPWPNDPVSDRPHEIVYLRDEETGELWTATALPIRVPTATYVATHGMGYSRFTHEAHGIEVDLIQTVAATDPVKLSRLRLRNRSGRPRRLSITMYVEWALGPIGTVPAPFVVTSLDPSTGAHLACNAWRAELGERVAFLDLGGVQQSHTGDRTEFLGRGGALDRPAALIRAEPLSGRVGAGLDPCAALQTTVDLPADADTELQIVLGDAGSTGEVIALIEKYREVSAETVLREIGAQWDAMLGTVEVRTPDRPMDILLNQWLLYQTLGCRLWARSAYYQSSGAYGFRDQLPDVMALCLARPDLARAQLLRAAGRQFVAGDVQHWWLPPGGQGVRTRITDDRLWLPFVAAHYLGVTGDAALLEVEMPFLEGAALAEGHDEAFFRPTEARERATVYEHCARAIDVSLTLGGHGLPLFGTGDWNDGMNRVGVEGRGESVWLAWFLLATIDAFTPTAADRGDHERASRWRATAASVRAALERDGWDGAWYRRGYYDDGTALGTAGSAECEIDQIAQSWSVLAGSANPAHAAQAMTSVATRLLRPDDQIAPLLTPPFDRTPHDPGYIKAYPPGIRENGGQYTHGAVWSIFAFAQLGDGDQAGALFAMLNPIRHSATPAAVLRYRVEPYVACADVYSVEPHVGRGGWTWYTGSAGWLYRAGLEAILGFRVRGDLLTIDPRLPRAWPGYELVFRRCGSHDRTTRYDIVVENPEHVSHGVVRTELDGLTLAEGAAPIPLAHDGEQHQVRIVLGQGLS
jgi:cyclic beta-1,2-glucan synthetase